MINLDGSDSLTLLTARELRGYTIDEVALACGVTREDMRRYEINTGEMPFSIARKIKRLFGIKIEQIIIG